MRDMSEHKKRVLTLVAAAMIPAAAALCASAEEAVSGAALTPRNEATFQAIVRAAHEDVDVPGIDEHSPAVFEGKGVDADVLTDGGERRSGHEEQGRGRGCEGHRSHDWPPGWDRRRRCAG